MPRFVAFLRAIKVASRFVPMADLAAHFRALGYRNVSTFINSGNLVFDARSRSAAAVAAAIEDGLAPLLGFGSDAFVRSVNDVHAVAERATALRSAVPAAGEVNVAFLARPLRDDQRAALLQLRSALDDFVVEAAEVYWVCRTRQSDSRFSNAVLERKLGLRSTMRRSSMLHGLSARLRSATGDG